MSAQWYIAKYIKDLRRREPRNIGLILWVDGQIFLRFLGMKEDGLIDGRSIRWAGDARPYKAWIDHWRRSVSRDGLKAFERLTVHQADDSYVLEPGGERLVGRVLDGEAFADRLFVELVDEEAAPSDDAHIADLAEAAFAQAGIGSKVESSFEVSVKLKSGQNDLLHFDYKYQNGALNLFQLASLTDPRASLVVHAVRDSFRSVRESAGLAASVKAFVLIKPRPLDDNYERQIAVLEDEARVVSVAEENAGERLRELLRTGTA